MIRLDRYNMSHIMRKPVYAICEHQRRRSDCADVVHCLNSIIPLVSTSEISSLYLAGQFESTLVANPEDRFSCYEAHIFKVLLYCSTNRRKLFYFQIVQSLLFLVGGMIFNTITSMPFTVYSTFVLEEKHGFNKQVK